MRSTDNLLTIDDPAQRMLLGLALMDAAWQLHDRERTCKACTGRRRCAEHVITGRARAFYGRAFRQLKAPGTTVDPETAAGIAAALAGALPGRRVSQHPADRALTAAYELLADCLAAASGVR